MKITKVELLWSRDCPFACFGCTMPDELRGGGLKTKHKGTLEQWFKGIENMRLLGSEFVAIYGAEPLTRMEHLSEIIDKIYEVGMQCTVITAMPRHKNLAELLAKSNLDSVTCSYDGYFKEDFSDKHRKAKSMAGQKFFENTQLRDRAVVATISKENGDKIVDMARRATDNDLWFLFDLYHEGHGPLSKCGNDDGKDHAPTVEQVQTICDALLKMKSEGKKIHASVDYLNFLRDKYNGVVRETWHCGGDHVGWLTIDADGSILPCDDYQSAYQGGKIWDNNNWKAVESWALNEVNKCKGCSWSTHAEAVWIEEGKIDLGTYVHE